MKSILKPCPFCGGEAEIVGGPENWTPTFYDPDSGGGPIAVVCKTCACGLHFFDGYAEAASAWNRRADHIRDATKLVSNADRIRGMSDEELAELLSQIAYARYTPWAEPFSRTFCDDCPVTTVKLEGYYHEVDLHECDFTDGKCPYGSDIVYWLQQPAETEGTE